MYLSFFNTSVKSVMVAREQKNWLIEKWGLLHVIFSPITIVEVVPHTERTTSSWSSGNQYGGRARPP